METISITEGLEGLLDEDEPDLLPKLGQDRLTLYFDTTHDGIYTPKGIELFLRKYS